MQTAAVMTKIKKTKTNKSKTSASSDSDKKERKPGHGPRQCML